MRITVDVALDALLPFAGSLAVASCLQTLMYSAGLTGGTIFLGCILIGVLLATAFVIKSQMKEPLAGKAVAVTGCDSGFGLEITCHLHKLGCTVFAGCLLKDQGGEGAKQLMGVTSSRMHVIQLDVTLQEQVDAFVSYIREHVDKAGTGSRAGLWGVVNNAGVGGFGAVEWLTLDMYRRAFEVNVWGLVRVTQGLLPLIRKSKGRVVNMSSLAGRFSLPTISSYTMTKYSVEAFTDSLRYEMAPFGVKVSILEPGNFMKGTNIFAPEMLRQQTAKMWERMSSELKAAYTKEFVDYALKFMEASVDVGATDLSPVVLAVEDALSQIFPRPRYLPMGWRFRSRVLVATHLPEAIFTYLYAS